MAFTGLIKQSKIYTPRTCKHCMVNLRQVNMLSCSYIILFFSLWKKLTRFSETDSFLEEIRRDLGQTHSNFYKENVGRHIRTESILGVGRL